MFLAGLERGRIRSRLNSEIEPGELRPSKLAVKREERNTTIALLWQARWEATTNKGFMDASRHSRYGDTGRWLGRTVLLVPVACGTSEVNE